MNMSAVCAHCGRDIFRWPMYGCATCYDRDPHVAQKAFCTPECVKAHQAKAHTEEENARARAAREPRT